MVAGFHFALPKDWDSCSELSDTSTILFKGGVLQVQGQVLDHRSSERIRIFFREERGPGVHTIRAEQTLQGWFLGLQGASGNLGLKGFGGGCWTDGRLRGGGYGGAVKGYKNGSPIPGECGRTSCWAPHCRRAGKFVTGVTLPSAIWM